MLNEALTMIAAEQAKHANSPHIQMMGEQLGDLCRREPKAAELVAQDLRNPEMGLDKLKKTFDAFAKKSEKKQGRTGEAGITPAQGEELIRKFYGIPMPEPGAAPIATAPSPSPTDPPAPAGGKVLSIFDFL